MRALSLSLLLVSSALMAACSPVQFLNLITPSSNYSLAKDVSYGDLERQTLDIYKAESPKSKAPVIIFIHGGSWTEGSKDIYKFLGDGFAREGYDVIVPNYRLYPDTKFPGFVEDAAEVVALTSTKYPDRSISIIGHSAGGHIATLLGTDGRYLENAGVDMCARVSSVVGLAAPTGAYPLKEEPYITIFPDRFGGKDAPLNNVDSPIPPMFLMNGGNDTTVGPKNSEELAAAITARGGKAVYKLYPDLDHQGPVKVLSKYFDGDSTLKADIIDFIDTSAREQGRYCQ
ncbi:MAG: alpha/beta hydrolase [Maricaulaceae bacterium]